MKASFCLAFATHMAFNSQKSTAPPRSSIAGKAKNAVSVNYTSNTDINERELLAKIDLRVLPIVTIIYVLAFLDRSVSGHEHSHRACKLTFK